MGYLLPLDVGAINGEGKVIPQEEIWFYAGEFKLKQSIWNDTEERLPGTEFKSYYRKFKAGLPSGVDCNYKIIEHISSRILVKIILYPSLEYLKERYSCYYLRDFEYSLKTNHQKELEIMFKNFSPCTYVRPQGLCVADDIMDRCILSFSSLGLKPLNSLSQLYTLSKVLTDHLNISQGNKYYVRANITTDKNNKQTMYFNIAERHFPAQQTKLKEW